jgi:hypothetical protein
MKQFIFAIIILTSSILTMLAQRPSRVPAYRGVIVRVQPTGDTLHIYLRGDERQHFAMTTDGWEVIEDSNGMFHYAQQKNGEVQPSKRVAHDADKRKWCERRWLKRKGIQKMKEQ